MKKIHRVRSGNASVDYVLVLAVILPLAVFCFKFIPQIIQLAYDMMIVVGNSPIGTL